MYLAGRRCGLRSSRHGDNRQRHERQPRQGLQQVRHVVPFCVHSTTGLAMMSFSGYPTRVDCHPGAFKAHLIASMIRTATLLVVVLCVPWLFAAEDLASGTSAESLMESR